MTMEKKRSETEELMFVCPKYICTRRRERGRNIFTIWMQMCSLVNRHYFHYHKVQEITDITYPDFKDELLAGRYVGNKWYEIQGWDSVRAKVCQESFDGDY